MAPRSHLVPARRPLVVVALLVAAAALAGDAPSMAEEPFPVGVPILLRAQSSAQVLAIAPGPVAPGASLIVNAARDTASPSETFEAVPSKIAGNVLLRGRGGLVLSTVASRGARSAKVVTAAADPAGAAAAQLWEPVPAGGGAFFLRSRATGFLLDGGGAIRRPGAAVIASPWLLQGAAPQRWRPVPAPSLAGRLLSLWSDLPATVNGCPKAHDYFPDGGMRNFHCHLLGRITLAALEELAGVPIFLAGPHKNKRLDLAATRDFGRYNPEFVRALERAIPAGADAATRAKLQPLYDRYLRNLARVHFLAYERLRASGGLDAEVKALTAALASGGTTGFYRRYENLIGGSYDLNVVTTAGAFWVRRAMDGTADEFASALGALLKEWDPAWLAEQSPKEEPPVVAAAPPPEPIISVDGTLTLDGKRCLEAPEVSNGVVLAACDPKKSGSGAGWQTQIWRLQGKHVESGMSGNLTRWCLEMGPKGARRAVCSDDDAQKWTRRDDGGIALPDGRCLTAATQGGVAAKPCVDHVDQRFQFQPSARRLHLSRPPALGQRILAEVCDASACAVRAILPRNGELNQRLLVMRPGLADARGVSFELAANGGTYLTRVGDRLLVRRVAGDSERADATFLIVDGHEDPAPYDTLAKVQWRSLESLSKRGHFIRLRGDEAFVDPSGPAPFAAESTFLFIHGVEDHYTPAEASGWESMVHLKSVRCLKPVSATEGAVVQLAECDWAADDQKWGTNAAGDYRHRASGRCLEVPPSGANPVLRACSGQPSQRFNVEWSDYYRTLRHQGRCLDVSADGLVFKACDPSATTRWAAIDPREALRPREGAFYCLPGLPTPVARIKERVHCASLDGKSCLASCPGPANPIWRNATGPVGYGAAPGQALVPLACSLEDSRCGDPAGHCARAFHALGCKAPADPGAVALAARFAPFLKFSIIGMGYPMSAQTYYELIRKRDRRIFDPALGERAPGVGNDSLESSAPTYYWVNACRSQVRIGYWWYYGLQKTQNPTDYLKSGRHHGDWESVTVTLREDRQAIAAVTFSQHAGHYTRIAGPRDAPCTPAGSGRCKGASGFATEGQHPVVYVGQIAHGSYHNAPGGPGGFGYWEDIRDGLRPWETWHRLVDLSVDSEPWMAVDRQQAIRWGPPDDEGGRGEGGVRTQPTRKPPRYDERTCVGSALYDPLLAWGSANGCYQSECLAGDDQASQHCLKECEKGFTNMGLTCHRWYPAKSYGRLDGGNNYSYDYVLPSTDVGLTRRRTSANPAEWSLP